MAPPSTVDYYNAINAEVRRRLGGCHSARLMLSSVDLQEVVSLEESGDWDKIGAILADAAKGLCAAGCEAIVICCNTVHIAYDAAQEAVKVPILHIAEVTAAEVLRRGMSKVALFGTQFTARADSFFTKRLQAHNIQVVIDTPANLAELHRIIREEAEIADQTPIPAASKQAFVNMMRRAKEEEGAEAAILACTELGIVAVQTDIPDVPLLDTAHLHSIAAVDFMFGLGAKSSL